MTNEEVAHITSLINDLHDLRFQIEKLREIREIKSGDTNKMLNCLGRNWLLFAPTFEEYFFHTVDMALEVTDGQIKAREEELAAL